MKYIFYSLIIFILSSCEQQQGEDSNASVLIESELSRREAHLQQRLKGVFQKFIDAYKRDKNSVKAYYDKTRYLNKLSNDLRALIREKISTAESGRKTGEGDWKELDKQVKEYVRKVKIIVKQPDNHSQESRDIAERELAFLFPKENWFFNGANNKPVAELRPFLLSGINNVSQAEIAVSEAIYTDMYGERNSFDFFQLTASPPHIEVKAGEDTTISLFIQAVNKGTSPRFVIGDYDLKRDSILSVTDEKSITYSNGKGVFKLNDRRLGDHEIEIIAIMTDPASGKKIHVPLTYKYKVVK